MKFPVLALVLFVALTACDQKSRPEIEQVTESISSTFNKAGKTFNKYTPNSDDVKRHTIDEVEKLFLYEYRVDDLPPNISAKELEAHLAGLGADRWDCFFIDRLETELRLHCKRHPRSYLRYLLEFR